MSAEVQQREPTESNETLFENKIRAFLLCEKVVISKSDQFSLINIFDKYFVSEIPSPPLTFHMFFSFDTSPGTHDYRITILSPNEEETTGSSGTFETNETGFHTITLRYILPFLMYGEYQFKVYIDNQDMGYAKLDIAQRVSSAQESVSSAQEST